MRLNTLHAYTSVVYLPGPQQHLLVPPRVAMRHYVSAAARENVKVPFVCPCKQYSRSTASEAYCRWEDFHSSPFSEGPWLLAWGKVEGWVCISRFCRSSSFGFHQWMEAMKEHSVKHKSSVKMLLTSISVTFNECMLTSGVHLLRLLACHTWELPDSTSPLPGYVRSSLGSLEPWGRRGKNKTDTPHCVQSEWSEVLNTESEYGTTSVWHTCIQ